MVAGIISFEEQVKLKHLGKLNRLIWSVSVAAAAVIKAEDSVGTPNALDPEGIAYRTRMCNTMWRALSEMISTDEQWRELCPSGGTFIQLDNGIIRRVRSAEGLTITVNPKNLDGEATLQIF